MRAKQHVALHLTAYQRSALQSRDNSEERVSCLLQCGLSTAGDVVFAIASFSVYQMVICGTHVCHSMRTAGIYKDEQGDGGRWELFQALRWASIGEIFSREEGKYIPCPSGFGGFGFAGGRPETVLDFLLNRYGVSRWPVHGKMPRCRARVRWYLTSACKYAAHGLQLKCSR